MADNSDGSRTTTRQLVTRGTLIAVSVIGLVGLIYLGLMFRETEPNYYQPTRAALITARERLDASFSGEAELIKRLKSTHKELEAAITALDQAGIHPEYRQDIQTLRMRLRRLEDATYLSQTSPKQLQLVYREIGAKISALIDKLDRQEN